MCLELNKTRILLRIQIRTKLKPKSVALSLNQRFELNIYCGETRPAECGLLSCQKREPSCGLYSSFLLADVGSVSKRDD